MNLQVVLAWLVLGASALWTAFSIWHGRLLSQPLWTHEGAVRMLLFAGGYAVVAGVLAWWRPRWLVPALVGLFAAYSMLAVGPFGLIGAVYLLSALYALGAWMLRTRTRFVGQAPHVLVILGLAAWIFLVTLTAGWPVHTRWTYWIVLAVPIVAAWRHGLFPPSLPLPSDRGEGAAFAVVGFPVFIQWLLALQPEVSADGLSRHLVVAARMASAHQWPFDVHEFTWALQPLGGDWAGSSAYLLGGEYASRLLNVGLLAVVCWLLYEWVHELLPARVATPLVAAFAACPLTVEMTGSLYTGNIVAAYLLGSVAFLRRYLKGRRWPYFVASMGLAGAAAGTKFGALAFAAPLLVGLMQSARFSHVLAGSVVALAVASPAYLRAWVNAANPVYPYFNDYFHSQFFQGTATPGDPRFVEPLSWALWPKLTFECNRFIDGQNGALGFLFFLLAPLVVVAFRPSWPKVGFLLPWVWLTGGLVALWFSPEMRLLYPALPLVTLSLAIAVASLRSRSPALEKAIAAATTAALLLTLLFLPAAGQVHHEGILDPVFHKDEVEAYLRTHAPERPLVDWLNEHSPKAKVAWMDGNAIGPFLGRPVTNTPENPEFVRRLKEVTAAEGMYFMVSDQKVEYFIAPTADTGHPFANVFTREFLDLYSKPVARFGDAELRQLAPPQGGLEGPSLPYAGPGTHDDFNSFIRYEGPWARQLDLRNAYRHTLAYSNDMRSRAYIRFQGSAITLIHTAAANRCQGSVVLDGGDPQPYNEYAVKTAWQARGPTLRTSPGYHTLQLRFPQGRDTRSSVLGCFLDIDGFVVE